MAKSIKCPTCQTPIEITPQSLGQVVKCPGCGRGIKLVAKAKPGGAGAGGGGAMAGAGAGPHPGESQRSYVGEPAITDEPPKLDTTCEVCGKYTDEADLVEDQGRLMCKECALAAAASRSDAAPLDFAPPPYVPSRRGNLINFTPITFVFIFFALVWAGAYLAPRMGIGAMPDMKGAVRPKPNVVARVVPAPRPGSDFATTQSSGAATQSTTDTSEQDAATKAAEEKARADAEWEKTNHDEIVGRFEKARQALEGGNKEEADRLYHEAFDFIKDRELKDATLNTLVLTAGKLWKSVQAPPPEPGPVPGTDTQQATANQGTTPTENTSTSSNPAAPVTPLQEGLLKLRQKDYAGAAQIFEALRKKMIPLPPSLTSEQQVILIGKAAADLGRGKAEEGRAAIDVVYQRGNRSRAVLLNRAMIYLAANQGTIKELIDISEGVKASIGGEDELAANIYGTILNKLSNLQLNDATRADLAQRQKWLDEHNDSLAAAHEGKLKWGIDWLPAEDVKRYRLLKGSVQDSALAQLNRDLRSAEGRAAAAQKQYDAAVKNGLSNTASLKAAVDAATAQLETVQKKVNDAKQAVQPQRWLEQFEPVVPQEQG